MQGEGRSEWPLPFASPTTQPRARFAPALRVAPKNGVCSVAKPAQVSNMCFALRLASIRFSAATLMAQ
jgi:hypothetical protein